MTANAKAFGKHLARTRNAKGFDTQRALADKIAVSHTIVGMWERGRHMPRPAMIRKLAKLLDDPELLHLAGLATNGQQSPTDRINALERRFDELAESNSETLAQISRLLAEVTQLRQHVEGR